MNAHLKAAGVVALLVVAILAIWFKYRVMLQPGQDQPPVTKILDRLEAEGLPQLTLQTIEGRSIQLQDYAGKVLILNFWASWCEPCVHEVPSLVSLVKRFDGQVKLLALSADYTRDDLDSFVKAFSFQQPHIDIVWTKDRDLATLFGVQALPESYIFGPDLKLVRKVAGVEDWDQPPVHRFFSSLVESEDGT